MKKSHYDRKYDAKERFCSYWHQIDEVLRMDHGSVLEVGIGSGFVSNYLREKGVSVTTLDIAKDLKPDIAGSVTGMPFVDKSFDTIICFEVLEHIPYADFMKALSELFRVCKSHVVISLPEYTGNVWRLYISIPGIIHVKRLINLYFLKRPIHKFDGQHYWEIGKRGYSFKKITQDIESVGFQIERTYRVFEIPYHRFFLLSKS